MYLSTKLPTSRLIHTFFEAQVRQAPNAIAIDFDGQLLTYEELDHRSNQLARYLSTFDLHPDSLVGICLERSPDLIVGLLAILKAGAAYLPLDPSYPLNRLSTILSDANPVLLLSKAGVCDSLSSLTPTLDIAAAHTDIAALPTHSLPTQTEPHHLAYVIYTSGSTGKAKGVAIEHRNTVAFLEWILDFFSPEQLSGVLASTSICFDLSVFEIFGTLAAGGTIILTENALTLSQLSETTQRKISLINTVPSAAAALLKTQSIPASVTVVNLAGEPLPNKIAQQLYELGHVQQVYNLYGPSEDTTYSTVVHVTQGSTEPPSIGKPLPQTEIFLFDADLNPVSEGEVGEIFIQGPKLARGYLYQPQLTADRFIHHSQLGRLYKTGDLGCWLPDGNLKYLGRSDHQVKIRGFRVELGEIEATISQHPAVESCVVVARSTSDDHQLLAYVVPTANQSSNHVESWRSVWDATYSQSSATTFNTVGWINRVTSLPFTTDEMLDWVQHTVAQISSVHPQNILEIGCGTGLLLFELAPQCEHYTGIDVSAEAIRHIHTQLATNPSLEQKVSLHCLAAHEVGELSSQFDVIVINSVIQYFPSQAYLAEVIKSAIALLAPGGCLFIGDVRDASLLEAFHTEHALYHASGNSLKETTASHHSIAALHQLINQQIQQEHELLLNPAYFYELTQQLPGVSVDVQLKRSQHHNELTQYRFDVFLYAEAKPVLSDAELDFVLDWQKQSISIAELAELLSSQNLHAGRIYNIPNPRIQSQLAVTRHLAHTPTGSVAELQRVMAQPSTLIGVDLSVFESLGKQMSYRVSFHPAPMLGCYEVRFSRHDLPLTAVNFSTPALGQAIAHEPYAELKHQRLIKEVRALLRQTLPDYMIPQRICCLTDLPLTLNGKIDRKALPDIGGDRTLDSLYVSPQTPIETQICQIWSELLDCKVGIEDSFFDLGGHSLLAVQLLSQIELQFSVTISLFEFLNSPTVRDLVHLISCQNSPRQSPFMETDLHIDARLHDTITPQHLSFPIKPQKGILLTGATGFLGSFLLDQLLRDTSETIFCLVRASNPKEGFHRLKKSLDRFMLESSELDSRVVVVPGDLARPQFGLPSLKGLAGCIHTIFHCAAEVNLMRSYEQLRLANVVGTQEVLRLAGLNSIPVHFVSTIDILHSLCDVNPFPLRSHRLVDENSSVPDFNQVGGGYAQTKWVGERLMTTALERGIPTTIHRAGMLTGHSVTGVGPTDDLMARLILGIIRLKAAPIFEGAVNLIPIDYACRQITSHLDKALSHIVYPTSLPWRSLIQALNQFGFPVELVPYKQWQDWVHQECIDNSHPLTAIRPLVTDHFYDAHSYLETFLQVSNSVVSTFPISTAVVNPTELVQTYLTHFTERQLLSELRSPTFSR
ncbi:MAG: amino acid adenylation domain-containing protein [Oculatellaceae cyanobacterium bins.114]|nr:amino acid adenylation domain-containing protein [Oculatellaceae cyanobacterium bins.114]